MSNFGVSTLTTEAHQIGGKAKGLIVLKALGYQVPDFFIINCQVVADWKRRSSNSNSNSLIDVIYDDIKLWDKSLFSNVAIRSSALGEDSQNHSFAGIYQSRLKISGTRAAAQAMADVIESAWSSLADSYRIKNNLPLDNIKIALVVQKMVDAEISGVAFGVNLQTGCRHSAWVSVADGLADGLVSGQITGDEFVFSLLKDASGNSLDQDRKSVV